MPGPFDNLTYAFGGSDPTSYPGMQLRQQIALRLMGQGNKKGYPKNVGEGLTAVGDALGDIGMARRLERQQAAYEDYVRKNPPPDAATLLQPPAAATTGPRADAGDTAVPAWLTGAQYPTVPPAQATADASPQLPPAPVEEAGGPAQGYTQLASLQSPDTASDADPLPAEGAPATAAPDPALRARVAQQVMQRSGVPQPNPMLAGQSPASMPDTLAQPDVLGSPDAAAANPPRATNIQLAQAAPRGGPAPDIPQISRVTPPVAMPSAGPVQQPENAPLNKAEIEGLRRKQMGIQLQDPTMIQQGELLIQKGKEFRDKQDADAKAAWEAARETERQRQIRQEEAERGAGTAQAALVEAQQKADIAKRYGGPVAYQQFVGDMSKSYDATQQLANTLPTFQQAKQALAQSYAGRGAELKLDANKMLRVLGVPGDYTPAVATEMLQSRMKAIAGGMIKSTVGSQNISDADREFVEKAYSGTISMEPEAIRRLLNIAENTTIRSINRHNDRLFGVANDAEKDAGLRNSYFVPLQYGDAAVNYLKAHPETAPMFDEKFGKGHAKAILSGKRYGE
jgi:hypothetical protein